MTFGEMVILKKLATVDEVEEVLRHKAKLDAIGALRSVAQIMQERGLLTVIQIQDVLDAIEDLAVNPEDQPIPGYQIEGKLGQGMMGTVYRARQKGLDRPVAIKILAAHLATQPEYLARFQIECQSAARISHPNIVRALTAGEAGDFYYLVMEYVEGFTAGQMLQAGHRFTERETVDVGLQMARALGAMYELKFLHRDIKPSNVMITDEGKTAKLCDLGLAKDLESAKSVTRKGVALGTPYYVAPEMIEARLEPDIRCDLYSLGATLFHMATGSPPIEGKEAREIMENSLAGKVADPLELNPRLSDAMAVFLRVALATDREDRYQTPEELIGALEAVKTKETPPLPMRERLTMTVNRIKGILKGRFFRRQSWQRRQE